MDQYARRELRRLKGHTFTSLHDERHTVPTLVLDVRNHGAEGRAARVLGDSLVLLVGGLATIQGLAVLTDDDVLGLNRTHRTQNTDLVMLILNFLSF